MLLSIALCNLTKSLLENTSKKNLSFNIIAFEKNHAHNLSYNLIFQNYGTLLIILGVVVLLVFWIVGTYNGMVKAKIKN